MEENKKEIKENTSEDKEIKVKKKISKEEMLKRREERKQELLAEQLVKKELSNKKINKVFNIVLNVFIGILVFILILLILGTIYPNTKESILTDIEIYLNNREIEKQATSGELLPAYAYSENDDTYKANNEYVDINNNIISNNSDKIEELIEEGTIVSNQKEEETFLINDNLEYNFSQIIEIKYPDEDYIVKNEDKITITDNSKLYICSVLFEDYELINEDDTYLLKVNTQFSNFNSEKDYIVSNDLKTTIQGIEISPKEISESLSLGSTKNIIYEYRLNKEQYNYIKTGNSITYVYEDDFNLRTVVSNENNLR